MPGPNQIPPLAQSPNLFATPPRDPNQILPVGQQGIYNAQLKPQDPWWVHMIRGMMSDPGLSPMPMMAELGEARPALNELINARNTLHHSTGLNQGVGILESGQITPGFAPYGDVGSTGTKAGRAAGFDKPTVAMSRLQRYDDPITFEIDPNKIKSRLGVGQGLTSREKAIGSFEAETGTDQPVPMQSVRNIFINLPRAIEQHTMFRGDPVTGEAEAVSRIDQIKQLATKHGIPVTIGTKSQLMQQRVINPIVGR